MRTLKEFIKSIIWVEAAAIACLLIAGAILAWVEAGYHAESFFSYRIRILSYLPAWFACTLALAAINGFWMFRLATIELEGMFAPRFSGLSGWAASFPVNPLRLFAVNLIAIPGLLMLFIILRAANW